MTCTPPPAGAPSTAIATATRPITAQRLVIRGYQGCLRRNYLIQLVNDDLAAPKAHYPASALADFQQDRLIQWCDHGILPRAIFYKLIKTWHAGHHLTSDIAPGVDICQPVPANPIAYAVDVGLTFEGFVRLEAPIQLTDLFRRKAPAYAQGALLRAGSQLGDSGPSAPRYWGARYQKGCTHAVLVVHAFKDAVGGAEAGFLAFENAVLAQLGCSVHAMPTHLMKEHWIEQSAVLTSPREVHFGYVDGLSVPRFKEIDIDADLSKEHESNVHNAGELLLGHPRNDKSNPWRVPGAYPQAGLPGPIQPLPNYTVYGDFFKDGSFGVLRKMQQDVAKFEAYLEGEAMRLEGAQNHAYTVAWLKAKLLGRWPNGEPVQEAVDATTQAPLPPSEHALINRMEPANNNPNVSDNNDFGHHATDPHGLACPFGAHIRRMNPRDDPVVPILRRPLLRRGVSYGKKWDANAPDNLERGMLGLFFCGSIEEQFEHVLGNWANNNPMGLPYSPASQAGKDPLVGNQNSIGNTFEIPMRAGPPILLRGLPAFVQTRGTCYAFFPSVPALLKVANGKLVNSTQLLNPN
jgi:deferrochelatase/peroxidase EfeB